MKLFKKKVKQSQVVTCSICQAPWVGGKQTLLGPIRWLVIHNEVRHSIKPMSVDYRPDIVPDSTRMNEYRARARARYGAQKKLAQGELKLE